MNLTCRHRNNAINWAQEKSNQSKRKKEKREKKKIEKALMSGEKKKNLL